MKAWKVLSLAGLVLTALVLGNGTGQAQYQGPNPEQRQAQQRQRIQEGVRSGALTPQEAGKLQAQQQHIQAAKAQMAADGTLDPREQQHLSRMLDRADRAVFKETHDRQVAQPGPGRPHDPRWHRPKPPRPHRWMAARPPKHPGDKHHVPPPVDRRPPWER